MYINLVISSFDSNLIFSMSGGELTTSMAASVVVEDMFTSRLYKDELQITFDLSFLARTGLLQQNYKFQVSDFTVSL